MLDTGYLAFFCIWLDIKFSNRSDQISSIKLDIKFNIKTTGYPMAGYPDYLITIISLQKKGVQRSEIKVYLIFADHSGTYRKYNMLIFKIVYF